MAAPEHRYWFTAKKYGWGWGWPCAWQGWVVLGIYVLLILGAIPVLKAGANPHRFTLFCVAATGVFVSICWKTGEPPGRNRH